MSLVTWPARNDLRSVPVSASLPRSERSISPQPSVSARYSLARSSVSVAMGRAIAPAGDSSRLRAMALADTFQQIVDSLPDDWTDMELDLRIADEQRYIDAATYLVTCNAQPYSQHDWHWRLLVAHRFGHAAAAPCVHGTLKLLDDAGIEGELALRELRSGRVEVTRCGAARSPCATSSSASGRSSDHGPRRRAAAGPAVRLQGAGDARRRRPRRDGRRLAGGGARAARRQRPARRRSLRGRRGPDRRSSRTPRRGAKTLAFYLHTDVETRTARSKPASISSCRARGWPARARRSSTACWPPRRRSAADRRRRAGLGDSRLDA